MTNPLCGAGNFFSKGDLSWEGGGTLPKNLPRAYKMLHFVKENLIGSAGVPLVTTPLKGRFFVLSQKLFSYF